MSHLEKTKSKDIEIEERKTSLEFQKTVEGITVEFEGVLERIHYVDLIVFAIEKEQEFCREKPPRFDVEQLYEKLYDFYGRYSIKEIVDFIKKLKQYPHLAHKYFEKYWGRIDQKSFFERLDHAKKTLTRGDIELVPLNRLAKQINNETKLQKIQELSSELEEKIDSILQKNEYFIWDGHNEEPLTKEMFSWLGTREMVVQKINQKTVTLNGFENIAFALQKAKFEINFQKFLGQINKEELKKETEKYGAKGANIQEVSKIINAIQNVTHSIDPHCIIPDFERIPTSVYKKWKKGESIRDELQPLFQWIGGRKIMIRSSAVYSEDNESSTGAGIYESISIDENETIDNFEEAVIKVFESVDAKNAKAYRIQNHIEQEEMGIVLQEYVSHCPGENKGYINTAVKQVPKLMDMVLENGLRPVIRKDAVEKKCANDLEEQSIFHYQIDSYRLGEVVPIEGLAVLSFLLEKYYGQSVQIEFIFTEKEDKYPYQEDKQIAIYKSVFYQKIFLNLLK
jgi:hypothetical protein